VGCHGVGDELDPSILEGRTVDICFDHDAQYNPNVAKQEQKLARKLTAAGAQVRIPRIPRLTPDGGTGVDDMLAVPGGAGVLEALRNAAPLLDSFDQAGTTPSIECFSDIETKPVEFLSKPRLPRGMTAGIEGNPGDGKTFATLDVAAAGSRGRDAFTGENITPFSTLYWSYENLPSVIKQRYLAMDGDVSKLFLLKGAANSDGSVRGMTLADISLIRDAIRKTKVDLLVIDPMQSVMGSGVDSHKANETRPLMDGLGRIAEEENICIIVVRHLAKASGGRAIHRGLGSIDITGAMRSVMQIGTAPDDPKNRALVHTKSNVGPLAPSLAFTIEGKDEKAKLIWKGVSSLTAADLAAPDGAKRKTQVDHALDYLREELADGPKLVSELISEEFNEKTLQRASGRLGVRRTRQGKSGHWVWALPPVGKFTRGGHTNG